MKKIGLLCFALVIALGGLGVGYAAWTDTVTINGTVNTGTVDLDIIETSSTFVFKDTDPAVGGSDEMVVVHQRKNMRPVVGMPTWNIINTPAIPTNPVEGNGPFDSIAWAYAYSPADDEIRISIGNAFPLDDGTLKADFILHYLGTIPVKVAVAGIGYTPRVVPEGCKSISDDVVIKYYEWDETTGKGAEIQLPIMGDQWEYCKHILVEISVDLGEEDPCDMGQTGEIYGRITVVQWNEYVEPVD